MLLGMAGISQSDIVRIPLERAVTLQGDVSENIPSGKSVRKFERTVLDEFGIQASVGSEVDVFEKVSVHGGLDFGSQLICLHNQLVDILCMEGQSGRKCEGA